MTRARVLRASLILAAVCTSGAERLGDFNGDGKADVLLRHDDGSWRMHLMDGASAGQGLPVRMTSKLEWYWTGAGDFNGDGNDDVMLRRDDGVWFYHPLDGSRVIVEERGWANLTRKLDFRTVGVGDFNADGRDDILMRRTDGAWVYYPMNGRRVIRAEAGWANLPRDVDWRMAGVGDFDGDGRDDVLLRHVGGLWRVYAMNGRRVRRGPPTETTLPRDVLWHATGVGDLDGDGRDDVLLRHADGRWEYRLVDSPVGTPMDLGNDWAWRVAGIGEHADRDTVLLRRDDGQWRWHDTQARMPTREVELAQATHWQVSERPVYIPDKGLRTAVASALGKGPADWMRPRELAALHALKASHAEITDLAAVGAATGLVELNLGYNKITTVAPLAGLIRLNTLYLHHNAGIDDVSALAHLPTLRRLDLGSNKVADPSPLAALTGLWHLSLGYNAVHDASPLASLTALRYLDLNGNRIVDIRPLAKLTGLTRLHLKYNQIEDISPLAELPDLKELRLANNGIQDIAPLADLTRLGILGLQRNRIANVEALKNLTALSWLWLHGNRIDDISPLVGLTQLTQLLLPDNRVEDIAAVASMTLLEELNLDRNEVVDIAAVRDLTRLGELGLSGNRVADISPLAGLTALRRLSLANNGIGEIGALSELTALRELMLGDNRIEDISPLAGLTRLGTGPGTKPSGRYRGPREPDPPGYAQSGLQPDHGLKPVAGQRRLERRRSGRRSRQPAVRGVVANGRADLDLAWRAR